MSVKIIRSQEAIDYSIEPRKVRIEFNDGTFMIGYVNLHAQYRDTGQEDSSSSPRLADEAKLKFHRTSDYLKHCNQNEGMITVYEGFYGGHHDRVYFVFLRSVKFISEEKEVRGEKEAAPETPESPREEVKPERTGHSLRERLGRQD
jgi:hypothetical protein